jgi:hypothetical protein
MGTILVTADAGSIASLTLANPSAGVTGLSRFLRCYTRTHAPARAHARARTCIFVIEPCLNEVHACVCAADAVVAFESQAAQGAWELEACDIVAAHGCKGVSVGANSRLIIRQATIGGCGSARGQDSLVHGLARCALQAFDDAKLELSNCTLRSCRQAVALFDSARAALDACRIHLPPQSFALALNDGCYAALQSVDVNQAAIPPPAGQAPAPDAASAPIDSGAGVARSGVLWASPGGVSR